MGRNKIYTNLTEEEIKEQRKLYMKQYYQNNKNKNQPNSAAIPKTKKYLLIKRGLFILNFD